MLYPGIYQNRSVFSQICILLLILFGCTCASMLPLVLLHTLAPDPAAPAVLRTNLFIQDLFLFILAPVIAQLVLFRERPAQTFGLRKAPVGVFLAGMIAIGVLTPAVDLLNEWNSGLRLPESLYGLQQMMEAYERSAEIILNHLLNDERLSVLGLNLFLIAIMAAVGEELLFRGLIQKLILRWTQQPHTAIWVTAFIFSAIHLQFFGFVPRLLLGALLGYLFFYSGSLWVCIVAHVFNNALTVLILPGQPYNANWEWIHPFQNVSTTPLLAGISIVLSVLCVGYIRWICRKRKL